MGVVCGGKQRADTLNHKARALYFTKSIALVTKTGSTNNKMVQALDKENHTTILKDMIEQAELKDKHKHLLQLEKSTIEERIDTVVPQENEVFFNFFEKSATKHQLVYRYGARKGNLTFFKTTH